MDNINFLTKMCSGFNICFTNACYLARQELPVCGWLEELSTVHSAVLMPNLARQDTTGPAR
jgi:hypothetical protein